MLVMIQYVPVYVCSRVPVFPMVPDIEQIVFQVDCICGSSIEDGMLVMCVACEKWSHGLCYRILDNDAVPETHICAKCPGEQ